MSENFSKPSAYKNLNSSSAIKETNIENNIETNEEENVDTILEYMFISYFSRLFRFF